MIKAKSKAPKRKHVIVPAEELNAVEQAIADAQKGISNAYKRLKKWYRSKP